MWKEWLNIALGVWLMISPWVLGATALGNVGLGITYNCVITGILLVLFSVQAIRTRDYWPDLVILFLAFWMLIGPDTLNYALPEMTWNNVSVGLTAGILAIWHIGEQVGTRIGR